MKQISRMMLLAMGLAILALVLASIPSRPLRADDYNSDQHTVTMPTHLGVSPRDFVVLDCTAFTAALCTQYELIATNGTATTYTGPPKGFELVVTDVSWQSFGNAAATLTGVTLFNPAGTLHLFANDATADSNGNGSGNIHFTAGLIYPGEPYIVVNNGNPQLQVIGYFTSTH